MCLGRWSGLLPIEDCDGGVADRFMESLRLGVLHQWERKSEAWEGTSKDVELRCTAILGENVGVGARVGFSVQKAKAWNMTAGEEENGSCREW